MNELIQKARELCEKATPGEWKYVDDCGKYVRDENGNNICLLYGDRNSNFIPASHEIIPQLCDALESAEKELEEFHRIGVTADGIEELYDSYAHKSYELTARAEKAKAERDEAYEKGFQAGQNNMLEAGYALEGE